MSSSCEARPGLTVLEPVAKRGQCGNQPQESVGQVNPDCVLHALDTTVALGILIDVHLSKDTKESNPEDEEDKVPDGHKDTRDTHDEWDKVDDASDGRETTNNNGVDPFRI